MINYKHIHKYKNMLYLYYHILFIKSGFGTNSFYKNV
jgi:hypothetical protein